MTFKKTTTLCFFAVLVVAALASDARSRAVAYADNDWLAARTQAICFGTGGYVTNESWDATGDFETLRVEDTSNCTSAYAHAVGYANRDGQPTTIAHAWAWSAWGASYADKGLDTVYIYTDTLDGETEPGVMGKLSEVDENTARLYLRGDIKASAGASCDIRIAVYEGSQDTANIADYATVSFRVSDDGGKAHAGLVVSDLLEIDDFEVDTLTVGEHTVYNLVFAAYSENIPIGVPFDSAGVSLSVAVDASITVNDLPSLTPYGAAVIALLLLASGVWLYYRRRTVGA